MKNGNVAAGIAWLLFGWMMISLVLGTSPAWAVNPIITHKYTADPAVLVHDGTVKRVVMTGEGVPLAN